MPILPKHIQNKIVEISYALLSERKTCRCFHVSFLLRKNRIRHIACNNYDKTHPRCLKLSYIGREGERYEPRLHSELAVLIRNGETDCSDYRMVNTRINGLGKLTMSRPCRGCQSLLRSVAIKEVWFSNDKGEFEYLRLL